MKTYKNGDTCPCCGAVIEGKEKIWLDFFSVYCENKGLNNDPFKAPEFQDVDKPLPPPDAGIYPPIKPKPVKF